MTNDDTPITGLARSTIRYAMYRVKNGNPDEQHLKLFEYYKPRLDKMGMAAEDFGVKWDIKKEDTGAIVAGAMVAVYNEDIHSSLFNEEGALKEF